jgi:hypothetical protein
VAATGLGEKKASELTTDLDTQSDVHALRAPEKFRRVEPARAAQHASWVTGEPK